MTYEFPGRIRSLPIFEGPFEAYRLAANDCDVLFASYPAGTEIEPHSHPTENLGMIVSGELILYTDAGEQRCRAGDWYHLRPGQEHWARFDIDTAEIEFWFKPQP